MIWRYDRNVGRFINQDSIGVPGGENLDAYAPNPLSWINLNTNGATGDFGV